MNHLRKTHLCALGYGCMVTVEGGRLGCVEHEALLTEDVSGDVIPLDPILRSLGMPTRTRSVEAAGAWVAREMGRRGMVQESGRRAVGT